MEDDDESDNDLNLTGRFFARARRAYVDSRQNFSFSADDLLIIIRDAALRTDFERRFHKDINDDELRRFILRFLEEAAIGMAEAEAASRRRITLVDQAGFGISIPVTVGAIAAIAATTAGIGSVVALAAGLVGIAVCGTTKYRLNANADSRKFSAERIRGLLEHLRRNGGRSSTP